jgi:hypothetical protein
MPDNQISELVRLAKRGALNATERATLEAAGYRVTSCEAYPKFIHRLPTHIADGHTVLAWVLTKNREGCYPGGYVLAHNPNEVQPYVVWMVCTPDGGETWRVTGSGEYSLTHEEAGLTFMFRLSGTGIATAAL